MFQDIDINADVGEGFGADEQLMPYLSSCSIACGGHAGNEHSIRQTIRLALKHNVKIGAHPSYPDREHFGRSACTLSHEELLHSLTLQLKTFKQIIEEEGAIWHHVKPHGQLYHDVAKDVKKRDVLIKAIQSAKSGWKPIPIYQPSYSILHHYEGVSCITEAFIDRRYNDNGTLIDRSEERAVIYNADAAWLQLQEVMRTVKASTFCVHGDNSQAEKILKFIREKLNVS